MDTNPGTVVGNPGSSAMRVADGLGVHTTTARVFVDQTRWTDCSGEGQDIDVNETVDLLRSDNLEAPPGHWCEVQIVFGGLLELEGVSDLGSAPVSVHIELDTAVLSAPGGFVIENDPIVLELAYPNWFETGDLVAADSPERGYSIGPGDRGHDGFSTVIALESGLYADPTGDGEVDEGERSAGTAAQGSRRVEGRDQNPGNGARN